MKTIAEHSFTLPVAFPFRLPAKIYGAMLAIWHIRPALQKRFPLHNLEQVDFIRFLAWCAGDGRRLYVILRELPDWDEALSQRIELPALSGDGWENGYSVDMFLHAVAMCRYSLGPVLRDKMIRHLAACEYWRGARHKRFQKTLANWHCDFLKKRFTSMEGFTSVLGVGQKETRMTGSKLAEVFGLSDIVQIFDDEIDSGSDKYATPSGGGFAIKLPEGIRSYSLKSPVKLIRAAAWLRERFYKRPTESQISGITGRIPVFPQDLPCNQYAFGVNLFGYAKGELGIGEDVRSVALALKANNIPFCIVNVKLGANISQHDDSVDGWLVSEPRYAINIFCTTGIEQVRYACTYGLGVLHGRYNIGLWPWELPEWPKSCEYAYALVEEIWGISKFTANAFANSRRPVYAMTLPVVLGQIAERDRPYFKLPENDFLFVFSFDLNSKFARKNPEAVIRAFQKAFPVKQSTAVGLVIKASHVSRSKEWRHFRSIIGKDRRIHVIEETMRRPDVLALYQCCDCFVSLHRSEGFGRGLAEALLLGKQLIATGYSGNMDYCSEDRVGIVRYSTRNLEPGEYFHGEGQNWAEPDIEHAAELMKLIIQSPKGVEAGLFDFSPVTVGARYSTRLHEIRQQIETQNEG